MPPVDIILSFSDRDKDAAQDLERHLTPLARSGKIALWHRGKELGGADEAKAWQVHAQQAQIIILLVSSDLEIDRDSDITDALAQRQKRDARVIPVLWRSVDVEDLRYKELRMIPDGRAVGERKDRDQAWVEVVKGIRKVVEIFEAQARDRPATGIQTSAQTTTSPAQTAVPPPQSPTAAPSAAAHHVQSLTPVTILFLGANPSDTIRLRLPEERHEIDRCLQRGSQRDRFKLSDAWAVTPKELSETLLRYSPGIIHFSGHGSDKGELLLNSDNGKSMPVPAEALARLFKIFAAQGLRCVVLNACYSEQQAQALARYVDCVVGISGKLGDSAAVAFSAGFYIGIAAGQSVQTAFDLGCTQIDILSLAGADQPKLLGRPGVNLRTLHLT